MKRQLFRFSPELHPRCNCRLHPRDYYADYAFFFLFFSFSSFAQGAKKGSVSAMLGSKGPVKHIAVLGLGKQEDSALTPAALEAVGAQARR